MNDEKTNQIKEKICIYLSEGMLKRDSAIMSGISEATLYRWIKEDESFESQVEASILNYKHTLIKNINECAIKDGRIALEILRRRFPDTDMRRETEEENESSIKLIAESLQMIIKSASNESA